MARAVLLLLMVLAVLASAKGGPARRPRCPQADPQALDDGTVKILEEPQGPAATTALPKLDFQPEDDPDDCICVRYYQCDRDFNIIIHGEGLLQDRLGSNDTMQSSRRRPTRDCFLTENKSEHFCCYLPKDKSKPLVESGDKEVDWSVFGFDVPPPKLVPRDPIVPDKVKPTQVDGYPLDNPNLPSKTTSRPSVEKELDCGLQKPDFMDLVSLKVKGSNTQTSFAEFPWMLYLWSTEKTDFTCGATLVKENVAVTAAHCVKPRSTDDLMVRAGEHDLLSEKERLPKQDRKVKRIIVHPKYYRGGLHNDIAVLILEEPFILDDHIGLICMPIGATPDDEKNCLATGWGNNEKGVRQNVLKQTDLDILPRSVCEKELKKTRLGNRFQLDASFICFLGPNGEDTAVGDGGGPVVCPVPDSRSFYLAGITSWGIDNSKAPGVYVDVSRYIDWIKSVAAS